MQFAVSQNLVVNGSMEDHFQCPNAKSQLNYAVGWVGPSGDGSSSEYYHICGSDSSLSGHDFTPPSLVTGFQYPKHGKAFAGASFFVFGSSGYPQEFIGNSGLKYELKKDNCYSVIYHVSLADYASSYAFETFGLYISDQFIDFAMIQADNLTPQIANNQGLVSDTSMWCKISGSFIANGGEKYFTIGNFHMNRPVVYQKLPWGIVNGYSYFFVDAVSIYPCNTKIYQANAGKDTVICLGEEILLGTQQVPDTFINEYEFVWYKAGFETDTLATTEQAAFSPKVSTNYVLKQTDFKYDVTFDTVYVGIKDCEAPTNFKIVPNPTSGNVNLDFNHPLQQSGEIRLYDISGRLIISESILTGTEQFNLSIAVFPSGTYIIQAVLNHEAVISNKIIKI